MENNIYQISARIKNAAAKNDHAFSAQGMALCNMYTHVIKTLYDFSDTLEDRDAAARLNDVILKQEDFPAKLLDLFVPVQEKIEEIDLLGIDDDEA